MMIVKIEVIIMVANLVICSLSSIMFTFRLSPRRWTHLKYTVHGELSIERHSTRCSTGGLKTLKVLNYFSSFSTIWSLAIMCSTFGTLKKWTTLEQHLFLSFSSRMKVASAPQNSRFQQSAFTLLRYQETRPAYCSDVDTWYLCCCGRKELS